MKLSWNWLCEYTTVKKKPDDIAERLTMTGLEVKRAQKLGDDVLLETEVTSNRADLLSHIGVAREIAAIYGLRLKLPAAAISGVKVLPKLKSLSIETHAPSFCPFYSGMIIEDIKATKTPAWMAERLRLCGLRSINFIVDVTNYVLLETGQPLHAFDLQKLNTKKIIVRSARNNERFAAVNNMVYELEPGDIVITDGSKPVALGGIMGGKESEVSENTRHILLESAFFQPSAIRKTSRRLKLPSESSYRFERGVDPCMVRFAQMRAAALITQNGKGGVVYQPQFSGKLPLVSRRVELIYSDIGRVLGPISISASKVNQILKGLDFKPRSTAKKVICDVPSFRSDVSASEDLIEEVARIYGYENIPETLPWVKPCDFQLDPILNLSEQMRTLSEAAGLAEVVTFSLIDPSFMHELERPTAQWVEVENPRNQNLTLLRPSLSSSFLEVVRHNVSNGAKQVAIFEIANRFLAQAALLPLEERVLAIGLTGEKSCNFLDTKRLFTFADLRGMTEEILEKAGFGKVDFAISDNTGRYEAGHGFELLLAGRKVGDCGLVKLNVCQKYRIEKPFYYAEISLQEISKTKKPGIRYKEINRFPSVERDLALIVDDQIRAEDLARAINEIGKNLIRQVKVFDLYQGGRLAKGKKSIAFRLSYQSPERTLEADEVNQLHFSIIDAISKQFKAELPPKA